MKLVVSLVLFSLNQLSYGEVQQNGYTSLRHNNDIMDYMLANSEDIYQTILRGGPGSTELLSQVAGTTLTTQTQAWFRCSRKYGINREVFTDNLLQYNAYRNKEEACSKSCFMEESRMVRNGRLDENMVALVMIMSYGDDQDIHNYTRDLTRQCNQQVGDTSTQECGSAAYLECYLRGLHKGNIHMPAQILNEYRNPWASELMSRR